MSLYIIGWSIETDDVQMAPDFNFTYPTSNNPASSATATASTVGTSRARRARSADVPATTSGAGHCSSLIKLAPNATDLFVGHATWFTYSSMIRIYKCVVFCSLCFNCPCISPCHG